MSDTPPLAVPFLSDISESLDDLTFADDWQLDARRLLGFYRAMLRTRVIDAGLHTHQRERGESCRVGGRCEEGFMIASAVALAREDWVFPCDTQFGALLERGLPLVEYVRHALRDADDPRNEERPLCTMAHNYGSRGAPMPTYITQAVGFAWANSDLAPASISAVYCGDQASDSADLHAALEFAATHEVPVVLLLSEPPGASGRGAQLLRRAHERGVRAESCVRLDPVEIYRCVSEARRRAAQLRGPTLVMLPAPAGGPTDTLVHCRLRLERIGLWDDAREEQLRAKSERELASALAALDGTPGPHPLTRRPHRPGAVRRPGGAVLRWHSSEG